MNERDIRDRLHALGPMVLRLGIAAVLIMGGLQRASSSSAETTPPRLDGLGSGSVMPLQDIVANLTPEGLHLAADWESLVGVGAMGAGGFLALGLLLRPVVFVLLGVLGYGLISGLEQSALPANGPALLLLTAACTSLLVSGPGCLALRRRRRRQAPRSPSHAAQQPREEYHQQPQAPRSPEFVQRKNKTFGQRVKGTLKKLPGLRSKNRKRQKTRYAPVPMRAAAKRWRFWQLRGN